MRGALFSLLAIPRAILYQRTYDHVPVDWQERLLQRLQAFTRYAFDHSSFYRQVWGGAGINPRGFTSIDEFQQLPVIARGQWSVLPASELNPNPIIVFRRKTSGTSSGVPVEMPFTLHDELQLRTLVYSTRYYQGSHWADRPLSLAPPDLRFLPRRRSIRVGQVVAAQPGSMEHVHALANNRSGVVTGYSIILWRAVVRALQEQIALPRCRVVQTGGEVLSDTMRRTISDALGAPVRQIFGATDYGRMALDCTHGHLHISPESTYLEILVDGHPADAGEVGEIVVTNFVSHARPLVRIQTGDFGAWGSGECPCGNPLPYIAHITGRQADRIILPNKKAIYWPAMERALAPVQKHILGYQAQQTGPDDVRVILTLYPGDELPSLAIDCLRGLFEGMSLQVESGAALQPEHSGKTRIIISQL